MKRAKKLTVPVPINGNNPESLEQYAILVEETFSKSLGPFALVRLFCRQLASKDPRVSQAALFRWAEMRFGKPKETHEHTGPGGGPLQHVVHTIRFGDGRRDG
jgi:hypothetical protein